MALTEAFLAKKSYTRLSYNKKHELYRVHV